jgi:hypothetical protein
MLDELVAKVKEIYTLLIGTPTPEEEEENKGVLEGLFGDIVGNISEKPELKSQAEELKQILTDWDPLDFWFKEVNGLSQKMKTFIDSYYPKQEEPKADTGASLDDATMQLLKAAGIDVEKLKAAGVEVDIDKLKAVLLGQQAKEVPKEEPKPLDDLLEDEEERKKKLEGLLKKPSSEQNKAEQKHKLLAPKIQIPSLMAKKEPVEEPKEEIKQAPDRIVINQQANKMKIKIKAPTKIEVNDSTQGSSEEPQAVSLNPQVNISNGAKPVTGPKISINSANSQPQPVAGPKISINSANSQPQPVAGPKISVAPTIQPSNIRPVQPGVAPAGAVVKPNIGPASAVVKPNIGPAGAVVKPNIGPAGAVVKPNIGPAGAVVRPTVNVASAQPNGSKPMQNLGAIPSSSIKPVGKVEMKEKVDFKAQKINEDEESIYSDMNRETLLQEMIFLQNKQFYFEKSRKILTQNHKDQKISDADYRGNLERYKFEIERIGKNLEEVRSRLAA